MSKKTKVERFLNFNIDKKYVSIHYNFIDARKQQIRERNTVGYKYTGSVIECSMCGEIFPQDYFNDCNNLEEFKKKLSKINWSQEIKKHSDEHVNFSPVSIKLTKQKEIMMKASNLQRKIEEYGDYEVYVPHNDEESRTCGKETCK